MIVLDFWCIVIGVGALVWSHNERFSRCFVFLEAMQSF